ncbi:helix-turn-helix transcriptional regulator [Flavobacterium sp. H122]|uniref:helix-turn-helix transcriptional regulator n=1 Tax=Flavobacterium sp. H122 TaxID=2529860 RepID=UPI0010AA27D3|nr:helix-turn-helix transcriptional regulator [Flavobacterium sp. H122]
MVNTEDFIKRLEIVLDYYNLTASSFADKVGVQRSSLSHLLSGRNKPSLDLILKIVSEFPEVDLYWILNGEGEFPKAKNFSTLPTPSIQDSNNTEINTETNLFSISDDEKKSVDEIKDEKVSNTQILNESFSNHENIERIVIFFKDGTFKSYKN